MKNEDNNETRIDLSDSQVDGDVVSGEKVGIETKDIKAENGGNINLAGRNIFQTKLIDTVNITIGNVSITAIVVLVIILGFILITKYSPKQPPLATSSSQVLSATVTLTKTPLKLSPTVSSTHTYTPIPTETITPSLTMTLTPTMTVTPTSVISSNCLSSEIWDFYPRKTEPTDGCWIVNEFLPINNGYEVGVKTNINSGEQQRGFYVLLDGDVEVKFKLKIQEFRTYESSTNKIHLSNIAFGLTEGRPFDYYNGIFLYYYAARPEIWNYQSQIAIEKEVFDRDSATINREQSVSFRIIGKQLTIYIDDLSKFTHTLTFNQNSFYFGYRLVGDTTLGAKITDLFIIPLK